MPEQQELPAPPLSSDVDLRDFAFLPLDVVRLRDSDMAALTSAEGFRSAVLLWCAAWHQVPSGSLPNDDKVLSNLAGFGRVVSEWMKYRDEAMRGWVLCSDGRLYHSVIAEKAAEAWVAKLHQRWRTDCAKIRKSNERRKKAGENFTPSELPSYEQWEENGRCIAAIHSVTSDNNATGDGCHTDVACDSHVTHPGKSCDIASKGQGQGIYINNRVTRLPDDFVDPLPEPPFGLDDPRLDHRHAEPDRRDMPARPARSAKPDEREPAKPKPAKSPDGPTPGSIAFQAYSKAYAQVYGVEPPRSAKVATAFSRMCKELPEGDLPEVASFYVFHPNRYYQTHSHKVSLLEADLQKLWTEWRTRRLAPESSAPQSRVERNSEWLRAMRNQGQPIENEVRTNGIPPADIIDV